MRSTTVCGVGKSGASVSGSVKCWATAGVIPASISATGNAVITPPKRYLIGLLCGRGSRAREFQFYDMSHNVRPRSPQITGTADRIFVASQSFHYIPDRIPPWVLLRRQNVVHIEYRAIHAGKLLQVVYRRMVIQHDLG